MYFKYEIHVNILFLPDSHAPITAFGCEHPSEYHDLLPTTGIGFFLAKPQGLPPPPNQ